MKVPEETQILDVTQIPEVIKVLEETQVSEELTVPGEILILEVAQKSKKEENFANYTYTREMKNHNKENIDSVSSYTVVTEIKNDFETKSINECRKWYERP